MRPLPGLVSLATLALAVAAAPLAAQESLDRTLDGIAYKAGLGFEPTQGVVGLQFTAGRALDIFRVIPNAHLGFGDYNSFDASVDFQARLVSGEGAFGVYAGAAPTIGVAWDSGESDTFLAASLIAGLTLPIHETWGTSLEFRWMVGDDTSPDFRLLAVINP